MAALAPKSIRLCMLLLGLALAPAQLALAGDVSVKLDPGTGFSIQNSTGAIERLRVDESTGNVSRNGALFVHTTGSVNTFVGAQAGNPSTTGFGHNSAVGSYALGSNITGRFNSAVGAQALESNTVGSLNSAVGGSALASNTTGYYNSALGALALGSNTSGYRNSAVGARALRANTTGRYNSAVGNDALRYNTTGGANSAVGANALRSNSVGLLNSAVGYDALHSSTVGSLNSAVGARALALNATGTRNAAIGYRAGYNQTTGNDNLYLANTGVAAESNTIRVGCPAGLCALTATPHSRAFVAGIRGATTANADAIPVLIDSAGQLGTVSSSRSVKKDIHDMGDTTSRLLDLRPVTFRYKQEQTLPDDRPLPPEYGLIAEEVAEVFPDLVVYDDKGRPFTVKYHEMAPMLLNEMKKQQRTIEAQRQENQVRQQEIAALTARLARLEAHAATR